MRLYSVREAEVITALSERTIRKLIAEGRLGVVRPLGMRTVRIPEAELERLTTSRLHKQAGGAGHEPAGA